MVNLEGTAGFSKRIGENQSSPGETSQEKRLPGLLITGASGFIGRHLVNELKATHRIFAVAQGSAGTVSAPVHENIEWLQVDVSERRDTTLLLERIQAAGGVDLIVHLAAYYDFTGEDAPEYQLTNIKGLHNILEISRELHPRWFIFASSVAACDFTGPGAVIDEDTPPDGGNYYARSKRIGEQMLENYSKDFPSCIVRFAALFSDWCEYEPLFIFLEKWLSGGWRNRILAGKGSSAVPYMHIKDAIAFFMKLLGRLDQLESCEILVASTKGATSHRHLYAAATACHFGNRRQPIPMPRTVCRIGLWVMNAFAHVTRRYPFERPWMGRCIDHKLNVDNNRTRARLNWAPTQRLDILRRMPFLIHNRKNFPIQWLKRNHQTERRKRLRSNSMIQKLLANNERLICERFQKYLQNPDNRAQFAAYLDCTPAQLEDRHHHIMSQLMCAIRTGDKGVFMNCCEFLAERWWEQGLPLEELWTALESLSEICAQALRGLPEAERFENALYDHITMTFQFAIDAVLDVHDRHLVHETMDLK
jgi:nucleoside-diphosphate-sugar epimerase